MEVRPILSALLRNRVRAVLVTVQIALTLAIVSNALFIIDERLEMMDRPTGIAVDDLIYVSIRNLAPDLDYFAAVARDLEIMRGLSGVADATPIGSPPLSGGGNAECFTAVDQDGAPSTCTNRNRIDEHGLATLGLELVAGRDFEAADILFERANQRGYPPVAIVTRDLADKFFPDGNALGRNVYSEGQAIQIAGIVARMQGPWLDDPSVERVMLQPSVAESTRARFMVRAEPGERDRLVPVLEEALRKADTNRLLSIRTQADILAGSYQNDLAMTRVLMAVIGLLVTVTTLGIVGLANASVTQRRRQIGTRRALGARRLDIVRYFLVENGLVTLAGVVLGAFCAYALNYWLVNQYQVAKLSGLYVAAGVAALLVLGQLGVLGPARRAAAIEPAIATRSV